MKIRFVPDWRHAWRWSSVRLCALFMGLASFLVNSPDVLFSIIAFMPVDMRIPLVLVVGGLILLLRITKFGEADDEQST